MNHPRGRTRRAQARPPVALVHADNNSPTGDPLMKRWWPLSLMLALLCGVNGCGTAKHETPTDGKAPTKPAVDKSRHETAVDDLIAILEEMGTAVDSVTDKTTADAAVKKIDALAPRVKEVVDRVKALP